MKARNRKTFQLAQWNAANLCGNVLAINKAGKPLIGLSCGIPQSAKANIGVPSPFSLETHFA
jgi:hypothetical protein